MSAVEALYIFDEFNTPILEHAYTARPPSAQVVLPLYLSYEAPRPSLIYLPQTTPPVLLYTITRDNLLFAALTTNGSNPPLLILEFLHRVADALTDFLGSPLLSGKIQTSYDTVAQLCAELCDGGFIATTEANALRDVVEAPSWMKNLLGGVGLPSTSPSLSLTNTGSAGSLGSARSSSPNPSTAVSSVPWRRANVRHTSNELYVDVVETLRVLCAPSGLPLQALACGSIAFTAKVSGIPDLLLTMSTAAGGRAGVPRTMGLPVFHPCVKIGRWRSSPGELSFIPPDGRFVLVGYECDLLGEMGSAESEGFETFFNSSNSSTRSRTNTGGLNLPASVEVVKGLGPAGAEFEVRLTLSPRFAHSAPSSSMGSLSSSYQPGGSGGPSPAASSLASNLTRYSSQGTSAQPTMEAVSVRVPIPPGTRNLSDLRASRGETSYSPGDSVLQWKLGPKEIGAGTATLRATVVGVIDDDDEGVALGGEVNGDRWSYDEDDEGSYQRGGAGDHEKEKPPAVQDDEKKQRANALLMPAVALLSFQVKGWLASGLKVESLVINTKTSRGLGAGVTPYKGVKYLTVSDDGIEARC